MSSFHFSFWVDQWNENMITDSLNMTKQTGNSFSQRSVEMMDFVCLGFARKQLSASHACWNVFVKLALEEYYCQPIRFQDFSSWLDQWLFNRNVPRPTKLGNFKSDMVSSRWGLWNKLFGTKQGLQHIWQRVLSNKFWIRLLFGVHGTVFVRQQPNYTSKAEQLCFTIFGLR